ncbi:hypothetical protein V6N13_072274 [Hibiscus sabdariffa]
MDVEMVKSTTEDHVDMMTMMLQMEEKLPDFSEPAFHTSPTLLPPEIHFSNATSSSIVLPIYPNPNLMTLLPMPSSLSFISNLVQKPMTPPLQPHNMSSSSNKFKYQTPLSHANSHSSPADKKISMAAMREMIFRIAAMQPIHIDPESIKPPKRRNVKISKDSQSVVARHRRERISERIRILQRLVLGGTKMDTASMLDEVVHYVKFLKRQVQSLEQAAVDSPMGATMDNIITYSTLAKAHYHQAIGSVQVLR